MISEIHLSAYAYASRDAATMMKIHPTNCTPWSLTYQLKASRNSKLKMLKPKIKFPISLQVQLKLNNNNLL